MANLIDMTPSILSQNTICFETRNINIEQIPLPIDDAKFGILNFTAVTTRETREELDFLFVVDCSGSMSDACSDGRSKMQHIIHTLKNMIIYFHDHPNTKINITINAFDTKIYNIVSRTKITDDNFNEIIYKVDKISPRGSTNIEYALIKSAQEINRLKTDYPSNIINHIFMTDGEATDGSKDVAVLQTLVDTDITNAFIGFGVEHDASLLNSISSIGKSAYYFIDKLESAGLVYGEILHGILYKLITESEINIENGLVYNFKTNEWVSSLYIGDIVSEANKIYNIASFNPHECRVIIKGRVGDLVILFPASLVKSTDLTTQIYRQRTLQYLYEVNDFCTRKRNYDNLQNNVFYINHYIQHIDNPNFQAFEEEKKILKLKLANFLEEIKKYITDNNLEEDRVLKNLCDDIYICFRTLGTKFGTMYCSARQTSQGTQRQYTASSITATQELFGNTRRNLAISILMRQPNNPADYDDDDDDFNNYQIPITQHTISGFDDTPYLSPQATQLMREISRPIRHYDHDDDDKLSISTQEIN
jgi:hypothetical protein